MSEVFAMDVCWKADNSIGQDPELGSSRRCETGGVEDKFRAADPTKLITGLTVVAESGTTIERTVELFVSDKRSQGVSADVMGKYERELERLKEFMGSRSKFFPHEIGLADLTEFRAGWSEIYPSSMTRSKVQERLRGFLRYCHASNLIARVPILSAIKVTTSPTLPLTDEQYEAILDAIPKKFKPMKAQRVRAFVRLMRHSGLAIREYSHP
jgi:integrase/recombinase XerD